MNDEILDVAEVAIRLLIAHNVSVARFTEAVMENGGFLSDDQRAMFKREALAAIQRNVSDEV